MVEIAPPEGEGVVVRPVTVGICGSDLHILSLGPSGVTIGHEIGAMLDGRAVAVQPFVPCGTCPTCRRGHEHVCPVGVPAFCGIDRDGGMADELLVDPRSVVELPAGLAAADASLVEPVAVGVHAVHVAGLEPGMRVGVVGAGTVGLITGAVAGTLGVDVDVLARHATQAACAERLGLRVGLGDDYDVVFDAAGTDSSLAAAVAAVRPAGAVVAPALYWGATPLPGLGMCMREVRLLPAFLYGRHDGLREMDTAAELLGRLPDLPAALVTHRFPLERAAEAFAVAADRAAGAIKVVVDVTASTTPQPRSGQRRFWRRRRPAEPSWRCSSSAHWRRQPWYSGPVSGGFSPRAARCRAVQ